jgi:hypothetical protein
MESARGAGRQRTMSRMRWPMGTLRSSWRRIWTRSRCVGCRAKFRRIFWRGFRHHFGKCYESSLQVGRYGEVTLEGASAVCDADSRAEEEGVATVEGDGRLDEN